MASLSDIFQGTPPTYGVNVVGGGRSPFYGGAKTFSDYLTGLIGQPVPSYGGKIDPGMSPTLAALGQMLQGYSQSPLPPVMGQAGGVLGRFMNPSFANPMSRMGMGFPQYFGNRPGGQGMQNPFSGGQNPFGGGAGGMQNPFGGGPQPMIPNEGGQAPPWMQPPAGGPPQLGGGMSVSPSFGSPMSPVIAQEPWQMSPDQGTWRSSAEDPNWNRAPTGPMPTSYATDPLWNRSPSGPMQNITSPTSMAPPPAGGMSRMIGEEPIQGGRGMMPPPPPPRLRPAQMTRQEWIDAGMTPGPRRGPNAPPATPSGTLTNIKMPKKTRRNIFGK